MASLRHILADDPVEESPRPPPATPSAAPPTLAATPVQSFDGPPDAPASSKKDETNQDEASKDAEAPVYTSTTQTTRRNANGSVSSVYSGNKIRHLKKEDGVPLWRKDIQYDFLCLVFEDQQKVFTKYSDGTKGHTFAEVYVDAMAKSSKCSKILKEKLAQDIPSAITMAMVCLLVNVGRMNTTLNFFPEMRAQLRTYHSIPALQAHQDPNAYKQLQDAPRLKSILKGATEDEPQPGTIEDIRAAKIPRTNPVNLIFVLSQYAPKISEVHFSHPRDFFDLVMRPSLSSKTRATAFLWLIWWYLESDFSYQDAVNNPYGPGQEGDGAGGMPVKVPQLESLTEEQAALENVDTPEEEEFGEIKRKERIAIVASEPSPAMTALKRARKERSLFAAGLGGSADAQSDTGGANTPTREFQSPAPHGSVYSNTEYSRRAFTGSEHTRSPSPPISGFQAVNSTKRSSGIGIKNLLSEDDPGHGSPSMTAPPPPSGGPKKGPGRGNWRRKDRIATQEPHPLLPNTPSYGFVHESPAPNTPAAQASHGSPQGSSSFQAINIKDHVPTSSFQSQKRSRPLTQHQRELGDWRRSRVTNILNVGIRKRQRAAKGKRHDEGVILQAWKRIRVLPSGWDSEDEGTGEKSKEDSKDKEKEENGKGKLKEEDKAAIAIRRAAGGVRVLGGFAVPKTEKELEREKLRGIKEVDPQDDDGVGEQVLYLTNAFHRCSQRFEYWDDVEAGGIGFKPAPEIKISDVIEDEKEEVEVVDEVPAVTPRPRQGRKRGGGAAGGRKSKGGSTAGARSNAKQETTAAPPAPDEDEQMGEADGEGDGEGDGDGEGEGEGEGEAEADGEAEPEAEAEDGPGELDDEDRELLGEADGDDSDDEEDEDGMDEDP